MADKPMPKAYLVTVNIHGDKHIDPKVMHRVGFYKDEAAARDGIKKDRHEMANPNTYGGLIDWGPQGRREYRLFKAEWNEVAL